MQYNFLLFVFAFKVSKFTMAYIVSPSWVRFVEKNGRDVKVPKITVVEPLIAPEIWDDGEIPWDFNDDKNTTLAGHPGPVFPRKPPATPTVKVIDF